jgi:Serine hydrolase (FSH1)
VLCIHGYRQNAEAFKGKIGSFRKIFKNKNVEFVFLNAPHDVPPDPNINTEGIKKNCFLGDNIYNNDIHSNI